MQWHVIMDTRGRERQRRTECRDPAAGNVSDTIERGAQETTPLHKNKQSKTENQGK